MVSVNNGWKIINPDITYTLHALKTAAIYNNTPLKIEYVTGDNNTESKEITASLVAISNGNEYINNCIII